MKFYYLLDGFDIKSGYKAAMAPEHEKIIVNSRKLKDEKVYNDFLCNNDNVPHVCISAIVGDNGSGKSSLVEFVLRLINNFAASTLGEFEVNPSAEHLHFIDNVSGELYFLSDDGAIYLLRVEERGVQLLKYERATSGDEEFVEFTMCLNPIFDNEEHLQLVSSDELPPIQQYGKYDELIKIYESFFYTIVSNYSLYAYNCDDFADECNSNEHERKIRQPKAKTLKQYSTEERNWLSGVFHKNDGYQTPLVLTPMRDEGDIYINNENKLSKERLLSLLMLQGNHFRRINGHLDINAIMLTKKETEYNAKYYNTNLGFLRLWQKGYEIFIKLITVYWGEMIGETLFNYKTQRRYYNEAIAYLAYKTIKISKNYREYRSFYRKHQGIAYKIEEKDLESLIKRLSIDHSHITRKIRRTLAYLVYGRYDTSDYANGIEYLPLSKYTEVVQILSEELKKKETCIGRHFLQGIDEIVPPPFFDTKIMLHDVNTKANVATETLSSGEKQLTFFISNILYHLSNLNSVPDDSNKLRICYNKINIILEEIELYFHPDLQRRFILVLLDSIRQMQLPHISDINISIVTHSPFVLSDIPSHNILRMRMNEGITEDEYTELKTFGANIHDILHTGFFMKRPVGDYAQWEINAAIVSMQMYELKDDGNGFVDINEELDETISQWNGLAPYVESKLLNISRFKQLYTKERIYYIICLIDEPIIHDALIKEYDKLFGLSREQKIEYLKKQLAILESEET